jgi:hypothetical protein
MGWWENLRWAGGRRKRNEIIDQTTYERGERLPSALKAAASLPEEVGEALSCGSRENRELGVTARGEEVEGAMAAYVLEEPTPSALDGTACWAGMLEGLATTVVMAAVSRPAKGAVGGAGRQAGRADCRSVAGCAGSSREVRYTTCREWPELGGD